MISVWLTIYFTLPAYPPQRERGFFKNSSQHLLCNLIPPALTLNCQPSQLNNYTQYCAVYLLLVIISNPQSPLKSLSLSSLVSFTNRELYQIKLEPSDVFFNSMCPLMLIFFLFRSLSCILRVHFDVLFLLFLFR